MSSVHNGVEISCLLGVHLCLNQAPALHILATGCATLYLQLRHILRKKQLTFPGSRSYLNAAVHYGLRQALRFHLCRVYSVEV